MSDAAKNDPRLQEPRLRISLEADPDDTRITVVAIRVRSHKNPAIQKLVQLNPANYENPKKLMHAIGVSAAAAAEELMEDYGDNLEPSECYRDARSMAYEMFAKIGEATKKRIN